MCVTQCVADLSWTLSLLAFQANIEELLCVTLHHMTPDFFQLGNLVRVNLDCESKFRVIEPSISALLQGRMKVNWPFQNNV